MASRRAPGILPGRQHRSSRGGDGCSRRLARRTRLLAPLRSRGFRAVRRRSDPRRGGDEPRGPRRDSFRASRPFGRGALAEGDRGRPAPRRPVPVRPRPLPLRGLRQGECRRPAGPRPPRRALSRRIVARLRRGVAGERAPRPMGLPRSLRSPHSSLRRPLSRPRRISPRPWGRNLGTGEPARPPFPLPSNPERADARRPVRRPYARPVRPLGGSFRPRARDRDGLSGRTDMGRPPDPLGRCGRRMAGPVPEAAYPLRIPPLFGDPLPRVERSLRRRNDLRRAADVPPRGRPLRARRRIRHARAPRGSTPGPRKAPTRPARGSRSSLWRTFGPPESRLAR